MALYRECCFQNWTNSWQIQLVSYIFGGGDGHKLPYSNPLLVSRMQFAWLVVYLGSSWALCGFGIQVLALHCHIREYICFDRSTRVSRFIFLYLHISAISTACPTHFFNVCINTQWWTIYVICIQLKNKHIK